MTRSSARPGVRRMLSILVAVLTAAALTPATAAEPVWVPSLPLANQGRSTLSALSDGSVILSHNTGFVIPPVLMRSRDGGTTWQPMTLPPEPHYSITRFATPRFGLSHGVSDVYRTADGGTSWQRAARVPSDGGPPSIYGVSVVRDTAAAYAYGDAYKPLVNGCNIRSGTIWSTKDAGRRWRRFSLGRKRQAFAVTAFDTRRAVALVHNLADVPDPCRNIVQPPSISVWVTDDGGARWRQVHTCRVYCISAAQPTASRVLVGHNDGSITYSNDGGRRWRRGATLRVTPATDEQVDGALWVQAMSFVNGRIGYASTKGGATWRTTDGGHRWTRELSHEAVYPGLIMGDVAALDAERAVIAGPTAVAVRRVLD